MMGHYTEIYLKTTLKDLPENLINVFNNPSTFKNLTFHEFFKCHHARSLFYQSAFYETKPYFKKLQQLNLYQLLIHTEVKNYDNVIKKFIDLIKPYVVKSKKNKGKYLGYYIIQDSYNTNQNHIYIKNLGVIDAD